MWLQARQVVMVAELLHLRCAVQALLKSLCLLLVGQGAQPAGHAAFPLASPTRTKCRRLLMNNEQKNDIASPLLLGAWGPSGRVGGTYSAGWSVQKYPQALANAFGTHSPPAVAPRKQ